jgi:hypothetical protein
MSLEGEEYTKKVYFSKYSPRVTLCFCMYSKIAWRVWKSIPKRYTQRTDLSQTTPDDPRVRLMRSRKVAVR